MLKSSEKCALLRLLKISAPQKSLFRPNFSCCKRSSSVNTPLCNIDGRTYRKSPETTYLRHFRALFQVISHPIKKAGNRNRTGDLRTTNATHYRLCYASIPFPLENFYTLSWRPSSVNHEFTFLSKKLCDHFFAHKGTAQMYGHGAFLRTQGFPCAILAEADRRGIIPRRTSP